MNEEKVKRALEKGMRPFSALYQTARRVVAESPDARWWAGRVLQMCVQLDKIHLVTALDVEENVTERITAIGLMSTAMSVVEVWLQEVGRILPRESQQWIAAAEMYKSADQAMSHFNDAYDAIFWQEEES